MLILFVQALKNSGIKFQLTVTMSAVISIDIVCQTVEVTTSFQVSSVYNVKIIDTPVFEVACNLGHLELLIDIELNNHPLNILTETDLTPCFGLDIPVLELSAVISDPNILVENLSLNSVTCYLFTLTGTENNTTDIEIPISSFQARKRNGDPTYLQIVIPGVDYADEITDRIDGTLKIDMAYKQGGEYLQRENIIQADLETVRTDEGINGASVTLTGHKTETFTNKEITLTGSTYRSVTDGKVRHRIAKPYIFLNPGDTVNIGDDTFTADVISYFFRATTAGLNQNMEIAEA